MSSWWKCLVLIFILTHAAVAQNASPIDDDSLNWKPMLNGRDLSGWVPINTAPSTWSVEDNMLVCSGKPIGELRTERMYQNFVMEVEWRHMKPKGNAGIFVWADDITARGVPFHRAIEVQVLENAYGNNRSHTTHGDIFPIHGADMVPFNDHGGKRAFPTENRSKPSPEWNHYRIECRDGAISLAVNGKVVTRGKECNPRKGYICIESEGGIVHYRNMRIAELPDSPIDENMVAIADRGYRCLYTGVDFSGWKLSEDENWKSKDWVFSSKGAGWLETTESFKEFGFIVDFRVPKGTKPPKLQVRFGGVDGPYLWPTPDNGDLAEHLEPVGRWNRMEGTARGGQLSLTLNGQPIYDGNDSAKPLHGPLRLETTGAVDFANIYVRDASRD